MKTKQRTVIVIVLLVILFTGSCFYAIAATTAGDPARIEGTRKTEIVIDEKNNTVNVNISGRTVARIDSTGIHTTTVTLDIPRPEPGKE